MVKTVALVLAVAALCAAEVVIDHSKVVPLERTVMPVTGAPPPRPARIINGEPAARGQFPYQVALYLDGSSFCGGSLIGAQWVLTAAHCASGATAFTAYLGALVLNAQESDRLVVASRSKVVHAGYSSSTLNNDVALVNLGQAVAFNDVIAPVPLATDSSAYVGATARVSGWGKTSNTGGVSNQLNYADLEIIANSACEGTYGGTVVASTLCAKGADRRSTCNGDSGGPLVDLASGRQIGVVSFGSALGCTWGFSVGFARVTAFAPWIAANTGLDL